MKKAEIGTLLGDAEEKIKQLQKLTPPEDTRENFREFCMAPLRKRWREDGPNRNPRNLNEAAEHSGYRSWEEYFTAMNRMWMLWQIENTMAKVAAKKKEIASGQQTLF